MKKSDRRQAKPDLFENAEIVPDSTTPLKFTGTTNPRFLRAIQALLVRALPREHLDCVAGCSNGPDLVAKLRRLGLGKEGLPCTMVPDWDRDGRPIRRGVYSFSSAARRAVHAWLRKRESGAQ